MRINLLFLTLAAFSIAAAEPVTATIDATRTGQSITKLMFGGFMEPATTQVWAEMLSDRKFFNEIDSKPAPAPTGGFGRRGPQLRWMPIGADAFVVMDRENAYVGEWSPRIKLEAGTPHGISQSGIMLRADLRRMPSLRNKGIRFAFDEWAPRNRPVSQGSAAPAVSNPMLNAMTNALVYHEFFRHSDMIALGVATGGMGTLAMDSYGDPIGLRMEGIIIKMLHDHFTGASPVAVSGDSPQHAIKGTLGVDIPAQSSGSPTWPLDVVAALSADHTKLAISVVNPTSTLQECELNLTGVQTDGAARFWRLTAPAGAEAVAPGPGRGGFNLAPPATMVEGTVPRGQRRITSAASACMNPR